MLCLDLSSQPVQKFDHLHRVIVLLSRSYHQQGFKLIPGIFIVYVTYAGAEEWNQPSHSSARGPRSICYLEGLERFLVTIGLNNNFMTGDLMCILCGLSSTTEKKFIHDISTKYMPTANWMETIYCT